VHEPLIVQRRESLYAPFGSGTLVWQSGITRFQSQGIKTPGTSTKVAVATAIFGNRELRWARSDDLRGLRYYRRFRVHLATMSAEGRARIAAAQRKRWSKAKRV
jgi:hypothetical protein